MSVIRTTAIILRHSTDREHDRVLTVLTSDHGQLRVRARGTKRSTSKLAGSLEPVTEVDLSLADGRTMDVVIGSVVIERWPVLHHDLVASVSSQWLLELVAAVTKPAQDTKQVYDLVRHQLQDMTIEVGWSISRRWLMLLKRASQVLTAEGFWPQTNNDLSEGVIVFLKTGDWPSNERAAVIELHKMVESVIHKTIDQPLLSERVLRSVFRHELPVRRPAE